MNIPLLLTDHCQTQIEELDVELGELVDRMVRLSNQRSVLQSLLAVNAAFAASHQEPARFLSKSPLPPSGDLAQVSFDPPSL